MDVKELVEVILNAESEGLVEVGNAYINFKLIELFSCVGFGIFFVGVVASVVLYMIKRSDF